MLLFVITFLTRSLLALTFYIISGGYNIKTGPGCSIELMKFDMGGSAAVLGAAKAIGQIKPFGVEVIIIFAVFLLSAKCMLYLQLFLRHFPVFSD